MFEKALAYARLLRLSNGPTALADVWMGYSVASGTIQPTWPLVFVSLASLGFYLGGMALNDANDAEKDAAEDRGRPIAEGAVTRRAAYRSATGLFVVGLLGAALTSGFTFVLGVVLVCLVVAYDGPAKATWFGPLLMGACRGANVLLGMSAGGSLAEEAVYTISLGVFLYITGVTVYARDEAKAPQRSRLALGAAVTLIAVGLLADYTVSMGGTNAKPIAILGFWIAVALMATRGMAAAILQPTPRNIGRGVGIAIQGLVIIDATLAAIYAGPMAGLAILALLPVTMLLARWIPQT